MATTPVRLAVGLVVLVGLLALTSGCTPTPTARVVTAEEQLCTQFAKLKNASDPSAAELLGPTPVVPTDPVTPDEAQRVQTEFFLRGNYQITQVRPWTPVPAAGETLPRFILVTQGSMSSDPIQIKTATGVEKENRSLAHPDILVEVRDGKIYGVRTDLHKDPNERPMSRAEAERLKRLLGVPTGKQ
jgi:hypothetical protein